MTEPLIGPVFLTPYECAILDAVREGRGIQVIRQPLCNPAHRDVVFGNRDYPYERPNKAPGPVAQG